jgi:branched-subunit amino acid ABC-type transport system permease component
MQQFSLLLASLPDGILLGLVYGLAAMGLTLIWGVMNVINLSHGPIIALGMFGTFFLFIRLGIHPYIGLFVVAALGLLLGILIYTTAVHRVINAPHLSSLLRVFGEHDHRRLGTALFTTSPYNVDFNMGSFGSPFTLLGTRLICAVAIPIHGALYLFFTARPKFIAPSPTQPGGGKAVGFPTRILALSFGLGRCRTVSAL